MYDVHVIFNNVPGELARFGQLLGQHGVGLEGGGVFGAEAHFLVEEGEKARRAGGDCRRAGRAGGVHPDPVQRSCEPPYSADG